MRFRNSKWGFVPALYTSIPVPLLIVLLVMGYQSPAVSQSVNFQAIEGLYEPSGIVQLDDGRVLAVEDEPSSPFSLLKLEETAQTFSVERLRPNIFFHRPLVNISDLEGVAKDTGGYIYAITSQSRKSNGRRVPERERLVKFLIEGDRVVSSTMRKDFRKELIKAFPVLKEAAKERKVKENGGLNIEGLSFDSDAGKLCFGLRAPLIDGKAIVVCLLNPRQALDNDEPFQFVETPALLDLDDGGIRAMAYDTTLSGYLLVSQREDKKKDRAFKLWLWDGDLDSLPRRVRIRGAGKLKRTEGIAPVFFQGREQILLLNDDGNKNKGQPAGYLLVDYAQLDIASAQ